MEVNYRYNSKNEDIKKEICDYILSQNYGSSIRYEDISRRIGINIEIEEELDRLKKLVGSCKNLLIDRGRILKNVGGLGWYILKPTQIASYTYRTYIIKPRKAYDKAKRILEHTNTKNFSSKRKQEHQEVTELNEMLSDVSLNIIIESDYHKNKDSYDNIKD